MRIGSKIVNFLPMTNFGKCAVFYDPNFTTFTMNIGPDKYAVLIKMNISNCAEQRLKALPQKD